MGKKILAGLMLVSIVAGSLLASKSSDAEILARVGAVVGQRTLATLPDRSNLAGPMTTFKIGDRLPLEEQVRLRIQSEKSLSGIELEVLPGDGPGEVRLRGIVERADIATKALQIAANTRNVEKVINDLAVPEAR